MRLFNLSSINRNLTLLIFLAVLPALAILLYTGIEQRHRSIENARQNLLILTHTMAEAQADLTSATKQILSTLALLPEIRHFNLETSEKIFRDVMARNPDYQNITLTALDGEVLASGKPSSAANLLDRKHVREAISEQAFAVGEYIISRVGASEPAFAFACPVYDENDNMVAVLTAAVNLSRFARYHDSLILPDKSFIAITDHRGIRLFYHPPQEQTNPIGQAINNVSWEIASHADTPEVYSGKGSDGIRRVIAFEQIYLTSESAPYMYVWAGIPETYILKPANDALIRNLLLMLLATLLALLLTWGVGKRNLIEPLKSLVFLTGKFAEGALEERSPLADKADEIGTLTRAFHDMAVQLDISRKTLRDSEARFRLIMDSLDAIVYVADMESYEVLFINEYGKKQLGDITGAICWQSIQKDQTGPCPFCTNQHLLDEHGQPAEIYTWEFQNTITGHWFYIHDRAIEWIDGRIVRLEVATDITAKKATEANLAEERERLAVTLASIGDGVITTDTEGRVVLINKVAETLTGWRNNEAGGRPLSEVFHIVNENTRRPCANPVDKVLASGKIIGLANHTALIARDGQERSIADSGAPIYTDDGRIIGVVLVFRDITEQLLTEQELSKTRKLESLGVLAGGIAHDFNNILAAILGNLDLALLDDQVGQKTRRLLNEALKASHRARGLTRQLLTFAKGGQPIKETASLAEIVRDSADFVLRGDKVACEYSFPEDLWLVDIDKSQISQVVQNIILNASQAMPDGGTIKVSCKNINLGTAIDPTLKRPGDYVRVRIEDTGIGIPADLLQKIFDPYFTTRKQGSGLGLAITHSIISKHDGRILTDSTPGKGTTFIIDLPASAQAPLPDGQQVDTRPRTKSARILVMDDEEQVLAITRAMLEELGHEVLVASEGLEAVRIFREEMEKGTPPDIVIMDLTIPGGMGGKDAVKKILDINPRTRAIVSSGYSHDPVMANFPDFGFSAALVKPSQLEELEQVIARALE